MPTQKEWSLAEASQSARYFFAEIPLRLEDIAPELRKEFDILISDHDELIRQVSRNEDREENHRMVALKMLVKGMPLETIVENSELSKREVLALRDCLPKKKGR
ncbi:MAG: hypothetical protein LBR11_05485 [Deltaproteobacteria bacterium]|nr:hypothetical protein [Deltaproteobacteria bacterium]